VRPAINVGISVSRVGGNAQIKPMKKVAGTLKVEQAQYRELEAFSKFGSDLDAATLAVLDKGSKNVEILKQGLYAPVPVENQVAVIYCGSSGLLKDLPVGKVKSFEADFIEYMNLQHKDTLEEIRKGNLNESVTSVIEKAAAEVVLKYKESHFECICNQFECECEIR